MEGTGWYAHRGTSNRFVVPSVDTGRMERSYKREFDWFLAQMRRNRPEDENIEIQSVFFGGGSPSLAPTSLIKGLLDHFRTSVPFSEDAEVTLEANPTSIETQKMREWRDGGVNRLSIGVQALNDTDLQYLGRVHSVHEAIHAIEEGHQYFDKLSFDLIYARHQNHSMKDWVAELERAIQMSKGHLSLYSLTIEPNTPFHRKHKKKQIFLPTDDLAASMYEQTVEICEKMGLYQYEVSNFAKEGQESQHNQNYWRSGEWIGLGPGAASRLHLPQRTAFSQIRSPNKWMQAVEDCGFGSSEQTILTALEEREEAMLMGLRTKEGVSHPLLADWLSQLSEDRVLRRTFGSVWRLYDLGFLSVEPTRLRATPQGLAVLNSILPEITRTL